MNFLAHAYLSFKQPPVLVGNMISDFVKGASRFTYPEDVQRGIALHRNIDEFTDNHPVVQQAKSVFRSHYRLYSAPIVDILFDHFLANDPAVFTISTLRSFSDETYACMHNYADILPHNFQYIFSYMQKDDWLFHYHTTEGIERSVRGLVRRATFINDYATACRLFEENYAFLQDCYNRFFGDLVVYSKQRLQQLG